MVRLFKQILPLTFLMLLCSAYLPATAQTGTVDGYVRDEVSQEGILFANVVLVNADDSTQVMGTPSADSGYFQFKRVPPGDYFVQVAVLGYHRNNSPAFRIDAGHRKIQLGTIGMTSSAVQLDKVVVRAKRPLMEMEAGKITMNISQSIVTQADNAFEMLKKFPGVTIDKDDNISLNGKSGVMVMVDDRPTHLSGQNLANYLRSMPGNTVDKIEVMTNPSSKYDAEGVGGIINLKTSRIQNTGFSGTVNAGTRMASKFGYNAGVDLNYRHAKFTVYGTFSGFQGNNQTYGNGYTKYEDGSRNAFNEEERKKPIGTNNYLSFFGKGGIDYYIGKRDILSLSYKGHGGFYKNNTGNIHTRFYTASAPDSALYTYSQNGKSQGNSQNHNVNLNYEHTFDTAYNRKLSLNADWIHNIEGGSGDNRIHYYPGNSTSAEPIFSDGYDLDQPFVSDIYSLRLDYEHPFNMQTRLEAGLKFSYVHNNHEQYYRILDSAATPNRYLYDEMIGAAYVMVSHTFKTKTSLQVGLRAEYTHTRGQNLDMDSVNTGSYIRPFPNISISQPIGNKNQLSLSYRYRLTRPDYSSLNPFQIRNSTNTYQCGNPYLKPEYSHNLDLTYSFDYKFFATVSYVHTDGTPQYIATYDNLHNEYTRPLNAGKSDGLDVSLSTQLTFFKIWRLTAFVNGSYGYSSIDYNGKKESSRIFNSGYWLNTEIDAHPQLTVSVFAWGQMPSRSLFTQNKGIHGGGLGLKAFFLDKTLTLSASLDVSFTDYITRSVYPGSTGRETISYANYSWDKFQGRISLSYRFGNNRMMNRAPRHIQDAEESSRLSGSGGGSGTGSPR